MKIAIDEPYSCPSGEAVFWTSTSEADSPSLRVTSIFGRLRLTRMPNTVSTVTPDIQIPTL